MGRGRNTGQPSSRLTNIVEVRVVEGVEDSRRGGPLRLVHVLPQATQILRGIIPKPVKDVLQVLVLNDG